MNRSPFHQVSLSLILLLAMVAPLVALPLEALASPGIRHRQETTRPGPLPEPGGSSRPLGDAGPVAIGERAGLATSASSCASSQVDLKLLVISADGTEADLPAIRQALDYLGTPYSVWVAQSHPGQLTSGQLASGCHAFYQGVVLTTGDLGYLGPGGWTSALTSDEWVALQTFEARFGLRQLTWYTYPTAAYGFGPPTALDTSLNPLPVRFTPFGLTVFTYVNPTAPLTIQQVYAYLAAPLDAQTRPLLKDDQGHALAAVRSYPDGRENLALTFDSNPYLAHDLTLSYGLVNWVTKGLFLGQRRVSLAAQVDDVFLDDDIWYVGRPCGSSVDNTGVVYRMTDADVLALVAWQKRLQQTPNLQGLRLDLAFNGWGTTGVYTPDTLTKTLSSQAAEFKWINHTYDHDNWDAISYTHALSEVRSNTSIASKLALSPYSKKNLVTPDVSGLTNPAALQAAYDAGVRNLVSDTSRPGYANPSPNTGIYNQGTYNGSTYRLLMVPRHPVNLYFNVSQPTEWVAEDNCLYPSGAYGHITTYDELLARESRTLLSYLLRGDVDPLMFHQANLRAYDGTHTLLGDLLDRTLRDYASLLNLPVLSPTMDQLAQRMSDRMKFNAAVEAGLQVSVTPGQSLTFLSPRNVTVPVTGLNVAGAEMYGGQPTAYVALRAGQPLVIALP